MDWDTERPMREWMKPELETTIQDTLAADCPNLELATLCLEELRIRGKARKAEWMFAQSTWQPIPWLPAALSPCPLAAMAEPAKTVMSPHSKPCFIALMIIRDVIGSSIV